MLLRFGVENHRSIRDYQEFLLTASEQIKPEHRRGSVFPVPGIQGAALSAVALYGSNASGKSSVIDALICMVKLVEKSHAQMPPLGSIPRQPFLLDDVSCKKPTLFECTFTLSHATELSDNEKNTQESQPVYTYGFKYTEKKICEEWLYEEAASDEQDNQLLFRRATVNNKITLKMNDSHLSGESKSIIEKLTRPNSLFLSAAAQNNHPQLLKFYEYFSSMIFIKKPDFIRESSIAEKLSKFQNREKIKDIIQQADIGITDISVREVDFLEDQPEAIREILTEGFNLNESEIASQGPMTTQKLRFSHSTADGQPKVLEYDVESRGTQVFLTFLLPALHALSEGSVLIIDELDTSLHPDLSRSLLSLFYRKTSNSHGAQLLFSTHDVTLLDSDVLQRDEIWFLDKGADGASRLTPLTDFKPLPPELKIEQAYRYGRFGGVPSTREFLVDLNADQEEEKA